MTKGKLALFSLVILAAATAASDAGQAVPISEQLRLARVMPARAMLYIQARDLSSLMKRWASSPVRAGYYKSDSFTAFSKSRAYLKLQDRKKDFESSIGFGLDEKRLAEIAGGASAVALYDIGRIDIVLVTEIARPRAIATALFKQAAKFEERSADGTSYYVRDVTTDGGRLNQQFCFAYSDGKLVVTTAEGLMVRALANVKAQTDDSLAGVVVAAAESSEGFAAHDVTMWLDQRQLNQTRLFRNYWIHRNAGELAAFDTGLVDLTISSKELSEQRWFKLKRSAGQAAELNADQLAALLKLAPTNAQLIDVRSQAFNPEELSGEASDVLFGELPPEGGSPPGESSARNSSSEESSTNRTARYSSLDSRFDIDVDDQDARGRGSKTPEPAPPAASSEFSKRFAALLRAAGPYAVLTRSRASEGKPFVGFERAMVVALKSGAEIDRAALERAIGDELRARFVVNGSETQLGWEGEGNARYVAQSLMERGAAYAITGGFLVLASSRELVADVLKAEMAGQTSSVDIRETVANFTILRIADAKPMFDTLTSKLDRSVSIVDDSGEPVDRPVHFFSQNVSSLIGALDFRQFEFSRRSSGELMIERAVYSW